MKKMYFSLAAILLSMMFSAVVVTAQPGSKTSAPSATFQKIWVDYDVVEEGKNGMRIHTAFKVYGMKGVSSYLQLKFQKRDGTALKDSNGAFDHEDGSVAAFGTLKPGFDPTVYEDFDIFMPYDELDLSSGKYELKIDVDVIYEGGELVSHLSFYEFDFTQPGKTIPVKTNSSKPSATFDRIWVDYDITEGGKRGLRIHAKFTTYKMLNMPSYLAIYFQKSDGTKLLTNNRDFRSTEGQLAIYRELDIGYDPGVFNDLKMFMPYSELNLPSGKYDLKMSVDVIYKEGGLIQHLTDYEFEYTKP